MGTIDYCNGALERATSRLTAARGALLDAYGAGSPDAQGAGFWLAAALAEAGDVHAAAELAASLDPAALGLSRGGSGWNTRLDELRAGIRANSQYQGAPRVPLARCPSDAGAF